MTRDELWLGQQVVDRALVSKDERRCGMVDDLVITMRADPPGEFPRVEAIVAGPMALSCRWPQPLRWSVRLFYRCLGLKQPAPVQLPWDCVDRIGVVVTLVVDRDQTGLNRLAAAVSHRFIRKLPGS